MTNEHCLGTFKQESIPAFTIGKGRDELLFLEDVTSIY
jgi:hypothetical protein